MSSVRQTSPSISFASIYLVVVLTILTIAYLVLCHIGGFAPGDILRIIAETSFVAHQNIIFYININRYPLPSYLYIGILAATFGVGLLTKVFAGRIPPQYSDRSLFSHLRYVIVVMIVLINIMQLLGINTFWQNLGGMFTGPGKYENSPLARPKRVAQAYRDALRDQPLSGIFASDMNIDEDPGMLEHRSFAYFLYPVDIRNVYNQERTVWVAYELRDSASKVPEGFKIFYQYDENNLIAIKQP
ncbi:MAG: hypothetical protein KC900_03400 [Candidatus Omnitrophica bacterium]|nr:hypothetical protein [Candidatus Omnitrophota bacterium]